MLDTTVVDNELRHEMVKFGAGFASLVAGTGNARKIFKELQQLAHNAEQKRPSALMWDTARRLTDRFENPTLLSYHGRGSRLDTLGVSRIGTNVLAASPLRDRRHTDPVEAEVRGRRFQSDCVELAREIPSSLVGRLGDDGVFMIVHTPQRAGTAARRPLVRGVATRLRKLAARRGLELAVGIAGRASSPTELPDRYADALLALEWAMHTHEPLNLFEDHAEESDVALTSRLLCLDARSPKRFRARRARVLNVELERFIKEVLRRTLGEVDAARGYFEAIMAELSVARTTGHRQSGDGGQPLATVPDRHQGARFHARAVTGVRAKRAFADRESSSIRRKPTAARGSTALGSFSIATLPSLFASTGWPSAPDFHPRTSPRLQASHRRRLRAIPARTASRSGTKPPSVDRLPVYRVAAECGFTSYVHFARAFRRFCNTSARDFRRQAAG